MNFTDFVKNLTIQDALIMNMLENGDSADTVAARLGISRQTVFNTKNKYKSVKQALDASYSKHMDIVRERPTGSPEQTNKFTPERRDDTIS